MLIIGTCSICSGPVTVPSNWMDILPPIPTCQSCKATKLTDYGPVIQMQPTKQQMDIEEVYRKWASYKPAKSQHKE
jgi:peptidase E